MNMDLLTAAVGSEPRFVQLLLFYLSCGFYFIVFESRQTGNISRERRTCGRLGFKPATAASRITAFGA